jgi:hypothetical protein
MVALRVGVWVMVGVNDGGCVPVTDAVLVGDTVAVSDGSGDSVGVAEGVSVSIGDEVGDEVGVAAGGGANSSSAGMSAALTTPSPFTSARLQTSSAPKITATIASMSLPST